MHTVKENFDVLLDLLVAHQVLKIAVRVVTLNLRDVVFVERLNFFLILLWLLFVCCWLVL